MKEANANLLIPVLEKQLKINNLMINNLMINVIFTYKGQQIYKRHLPKNKMYLTVSLYYFGIANIVLILYIENQRINLSSSQIDEITSIKILAYTPTVSQSINKQPLI